MHCCLFSLTSSVNAHTVLCPDPCSVPEKLFLPLAQTTAQLSSNPSPLFFPFVIEQSTWNEKLARLLSTSYGARLALYEHDKEWPVVTTFNFAHWVTRSDKHSSLSTCRKKSHQHHPWTQGDCLPPTRSSGSADFHPWIYSACPRVQPLTGKLIHMRGLSERSARCTVAQWHEILVGSWKGKARGNTCWWSPSICPFQSEASTVIRAAMDIIGLFSSACGAHCGNLSLNNPPILAKQAKLNPLNRQIQRQLTEAGVAQQLSKKCQKCRMVGVGHDLWRSSGPVPCSNRDT